MEQFVERALSLLLLCVGGSHCCAAGVWVELLRDVRDSRYGAFITAAVTLPTGVFVVAGHNVWRLDVGLFSTVLGWLYVAKGALCLWAPTRSKAMAAAVDSVGAERKLRIVGWSMVALGTVIGARAWFGLI